MTARKTRRSQSRVLRRPGTVKKEHPKVAKRASTEKRDNSGSTTAKKDLTRNPIRVQNPSQRIGVFIDVQNMYYSARNLYHSKVNFRNLLDTCVNGRKLLRAFAYVIKADVKEEKNFFDALQNMGIEVRAKDLQVFYGGAKKGDWDVGIAMDIMRMANKLDVIVLASGDGDFKDLLEHVKALGCRAEVFSFGRSSSSRLKEEADLFFDLDLDKERYLIRK